MLGKQPSKRYLTGKKPNLRQWAHYIEKNTPVSTTQMATYLSIHQNTTPDVHLPPQSTVCSKPVKPVVPVHRGSVMWWAGDNVLIEAMWKIPHSHRSC